MEEKDDIYKNLVTLLKLFKNRPYHLAKFLVDKKALTDKFYQEILSSNKLPDLDFDSKKQKPIYFSSIDQMEDYFQSLLEPQKAKPKTTQQIEKELNTKLDQLIKNENYEDAACLRDYMIMKGFKRKFKF
jgi:hypothetical protein